LKQLPELSRTERNRAQMWTQWKYNKRTHIREREWKTCSWRNRHSYSPTGSAKI